MPGIKYRIVAQFASAHARTGGPPPAGTTGAAAITHDRYVFVRRRPQSFSGLYQPGEPAGGC